MVPLELEIPESFYQPEERSNYLVTAERKQLWAVQLDLLNKFQGICKRHNLKYWADGGTLLGAVRHQGFIPWDDDIDIVMLRDDFNKFIDFAQEELNYPYFLSAPSTDPYRCNFSAALVREDTTMLHNNNIPNYPAHLGIQIDIFPYDTYVEGDELTYFLSKLRQDKIDLHMLRGQLNRDKITMDFCLGRRNCLFNEYNKRISRLNKVNNNTLCQYEQYQPNQNKIFLRPSDSFSIDSPIGQFEMIEIPLLDNYEKVLETRYGSNWKEPKVGDSLHSVYYFSTDIGYKDFLKLN